MYDVITVGSGTIDVFAWTDTKTRNIGRNKLFCYPVGSKILVNKLAISTGGGGTNTAVSLSRLGLKTAWIGKVGKDENGKRILEEIKKENVDFMGTIDEKEMSGYSIILDSKYEKDRTILTYKGANDKLRFSEIDVKSLSTKWFYLCAMENESFKTIKKIADYAKNKKIKVLFNPSSYLAKQGIDYLKKIIDATSILILNKEEAQYLLKIRTKKITKLLKELQKYVPIVVITDGERGAFSYNGIRLY